MCQAAIVVPCYNEQTRLDAEALSSFSCKHPELIFILVDDGSADGTGAVLASLSERHTRSMRVISLPVNRGKAEAVRSGMLEALKTEAPFLGYWDADLSTPLDEIPAFINLLRDKAECEMVIGCRLRRLGANISRTFIRHLIGRTVATMVSCYLKLPVYDTQCGAKLFRRETASELFREPFVSRWLFDVELLRRMSRGRAITAVCEHPLSAWQDVDGAKLKLRHGILILWEMLRIIRHYR